MREIKFRGKRQDNGEWIYGSLILSNFSAFIAVMVNTLNNEKIMSMEYHKVNPETVGQFIDQYDEDGKEIYDGDLLLKDGYNDTYDGCMAEVFFKESAFKMRNRDYRRDGQIIKKVTPECGGYCTWIAQGGSGYRIVGNIYDNPDL